eukprot:g1220.t1
MVLRNKKKLYALTFALFCLVQVKATILRRQGTLDTHSAEAETRTTLKAVTVEDFKNCFSQTASDHAMDVSKAKNSLKQKMDNLFVVCNGLLEALELKLKAFEEGDEEGKKVRKLPQAVKITANHTRFLIESLRKLKTLIINEEVGGEELLSLIKFLGLKEHLQELLKSAESVKTLCSRIKGGHCGEGPYSLPFNLDTLAAEKEATERAIARRKAAAKKAAEESAGKIAEFID